LNVSAESYNFGINDSLYILAKEYNLHLRTCSHAEGSEYRTNTYRTFSHKWKDPMRDPNLKTNVVTTLSTHGLVIFRLFISVVVYPVSNCHVAFMPLNRSEHFRHSSASHWPLSAEKCTQA